MEKNNSNKPTVNYWIEILLGGGGFGSLILQHGLEDAMNKYPIFFLIMNAIGWTALFYSIVSVFKKKKIIKNLLPSFNKYDPLILSFFLISFLF